MVLKTIEGNIVDVVNEEIYGGIVSFDENIINIKKTAKSYSTYIVPGYVDSHIHIESTMMVPSSFSHVVAPHGTSAVVADPHEIANVHGVAGIEYMIRDSLNADIDVYFTAPSCVPATGFETSGAILSASDIAFLLKKKEFVALGEMMNYPGVLAKDPDVIAKINAAKTYSKPIDGHCPGLKGRDLKKYIAEGISTDHESTTLEEAQEKIDAGMKLFIRQGSSAKDLKNLIDAKGAFAFCTDDKHASELLNNGHMDSILNMATEYGMDPVKALRMATYNPVTHYNLKGGKIENGDIANIAELSSLDDFLPLRCYHKGDLVGAKGHPVREAKRTATPYPLMNAAKITEKELNNLNKGDAIYAVDGSLLTGHLSNFNPLEVQKIVVVNRYSKTAPSVALIKGFSLEECALAQTIAHDSHNIIATGSDDNLISKAVNALINMNGGIVTCDNKDCISLPLEVAGLMSIQSPEKIAYKVDTIMKFLTIHGCALSEPITTLSFMALLVIPHLKISDKGLFNVDTFSFIKQN